MTLIKEDSVRRIPFQPYDKLRRNPSVDPLAYAVNFSTWPTKNTLMEIHYTIEKGWIYIGAVTNDMLEDWMYLIPGSSEEDIQKALKKLAEDTKTYGLKAIYVEGNSIVTRTFNPE